MEVVIRCENRRLKAVSTVAIGRCTTFLIAAVFFAKSRISLPTSLLSSLVPSAECLCLSPGHRHSVKAAISCSTARFFFADNCENACKSNCSSSVNSRKYGTSLICSSTSPSKKSADVSNECASATTASAVGARIPLSHCETVACETPTRRASCSCVKPSASRNAIILLPMAFETSMPPLYHLSMGCGK